MGWRVCNGTCNLSAGLLLSLEEAGKASQRRGHHKSLEEEGESCGEGALCRRELGQNLYLSLVPTTAPATDTPSELLTPSPTLEVL